MIKLMKHLLDNRNSTYIINGIAAAGALIIVLLILSSNVSARKSKINQIPESTRKTLSDVERIRNELIEHPDDWQLNVMMGNKLFDLQKYRAAIPYYKKALGIVPKNTEAMVDLGVCYFNIQIYDSAAIAMHQALQIDPEHITALFNLGVIYYNSGDMIQAESHWQTLITKYPEARESEIAKNLLNKIKS